MRRKQWLPKGRGVEGGARNTRRMGRQAKREIRQKVVRRSYTHRDSSRSFVRSFLLFLFFLFPFFPSYSFFLFYHRCLLRHFSARNVPYSSWDLRTELYNALTDISDCHSRDLNRFDCFFDRELISRAKLLLRSHKRAWPRIEWLVMGVNYVQLYCVCARRIYWSATISYSRQMRISVFKLLAIPLSLNIIINICNALEIQKSEVYPKTIILKETDFQVQNNLLKQLLWVYYESSRKTIFWIQSWNVKSGMKEDCFINKDFRFFEHILFLEYFL